MTLADRLSALSDEKRRLVEMRLRLAREGAAAAPPLAPREHPDGTAPLSFAQARVWLLDRLDPASPAWNIPFSLRLRGRLNVPALEQALNELRRRHASLRTTVQERGGEPVQVIHPWAPVPLAVDDLSGLDPDARLAEAERRAHDDASTGFDLAAGPLLRTRLLRLADDDHVLLAVLHHVVGDGWSMGVITRELAALYGAFVRGLPDPLPPPALQYADFAAWQREWFSGARLQREVAFWRGTLAGAPPALELPADHPRPRMQGNQGARAGIALSPDSVVRLRELARAENATLFAVVLAAVRAVLARWSGSDDVVIGTPTAGRGRVETEGLVGFFVNTLALRTSTAGDPPFRELVRRERGTQLDAFGHQDLPFERVVEELRVVRDPARHPVFQVMVALQNAGGDGLELEGLRAEPVDAGWAASKFDLSFEAHELSEALTLACDYDTALFEPHTAAALVSHVGWVLERASRDAGAPLSALTVAGEDDIAQTAAWATGAPDPVLGETIPARFAAVARRMGDAPALAWRGGSMPYAELDARTAALAMELRALGVGAESIVGVFLEWSPELPLAMLAAMRAGGAYLPLDPSLPAERIALLLEDSKAGAIVTTAALRDQLPETDIPVALVDADRSDAASADLSRYGGGGRPEAAGGGAVPADLPDADLPGIHPDSAAYLFYTSGSTGTPKGVLVPHGAAFAHFASAVDLYEMTPADRMLGFAAQGFDPSLEQLITPLVCGASLAVRDPEMWAPADFPERIRELGVTVVNPPTPYWHQLMRDAAPAEAVKRQVRLMIVGGDAMHPHAARTWDALPGDAALINVYGPTETVVTSTAHRFPVGYARTNEARVSVGAPMAGREPRVLDAALRPVPVGAPGELYLGGVVQSRGYHRRPAMTAAAFLPDPFSARPGARMYRTGDRARWRPDGTLEFLGRADEQVKVRGARAEPGEVEAALRTLPSVAEGAVVARPDGQGAMHLVAFVVPRGAFDASAIRAELARDLPAYLVPSLVVAIDSLPRTPNGKIDRRALPSPDFGAAAERHVAPSTPDEEMLAALWAEVLGADAIGAGDDFFERGGHSLLATQLVSRVRQAFGVEMPLRAVFEAPVLRDQATRIAALRGEGEGAPAGGIPHADRSQPLPLSFAQERLWFIDQLEPGSAAYNVPLALDLVGRLDVAALERALGEIVRRHESLRTVFSVRDDRPVQSILSSISFPLPLADLRALPGDERDDEAERLVAREARTPFDLAAGPLIRATLLRNGAEEHTLVLVFHHVVTDAWSAGIFFGELAALYQAFAAGDDSPLPELPVQYADFAAWQRGWLRGEALERQMDYWRRKLAGIPAVLELPTDRPRPPVQDTAGALLPFHLPARTVDAARTLARREGATLFMVLVAAFDAVLHRWSGEEDIVVGTPIANRTRPELERLIGFFDNTLALRTDLSGDPAFSALLRRVRETTLEAYAHQDVPFEKLVDELKVERSLAHAPLFQVMLTLQNTPTGGGARLGGVEIRGRAADTGTSRFDLTLILSEAGDGALQGLAEYATALFDAATVERITAHLDALLRQGAERPDAPLSSLSVLSDEEEETVLRAFNAYEIATPERPVHAVVARQAARTPDAIAIEYRGERVTYAQMEARANRLAHRLIALGVRPDARVAVSMERSADMVVSVLAVLKAGGSYVPLDPAYPADRVAYMLEDSGAAVLLTTTSAATRLPRTGAAVVRLDADRAEIDAGSADDPRVEVDPENLLYVLYTSGSTGKPKGAALPHRALSNLLAWQTGRFGGEPAARTLQFSSLSFDASFHEMFSCWMTGGTLVLVDEDTRRDGEALLAYLREHRIERLFIPFAGLQNLAEVAEQADARLPELRLVITAGEALRSTPQLRAFFASNPGCVLENHYGPSETHVITAFRLHPDPAEWAPLPPIGVPVANTQMYVLDRGMRPVPVGVPGELYAGGANTGRCYLGRPALTAEKFIPDPFGPAGSRMYRTGDRVRWLADGNLDYLGRTDFQVKIRGFRVEPGEIEAALTEHPSVVQAAVVVHGQGAAKRLAAYVVPTAGAAPAAAELRAHLVARLPEYMVPAAWMVMEALPLTPSGKVDRRALPEPAGAAPEAGHVPPRTPAERMVAAAWADVLGVHPGAHDNFFELGGHSLRATQVMARIRRAFGIDLPLRALFESPTVAGLAERAAAARKAESTPPLVPRERGATARLSFAQQRFWFVERMGAAGAAYNLPLALRLRGELDLGALAAAVDGLAERHESLRTVFRFEGGEPVQEVLPPAPATVPVHDVSDLPHAEREEEARRIAVDEAHLPFDLERGPPVRYQVVRLAADDHLLLITLHHIVADGWSLGILFRELGALYRAAREGVPDPLPPLPIQYADFAEWQRERLSGAALEGEVEWWRQRLDGASTLALPTDRPHPPVQSFRGGTLPISLPPELGERVERLAREEDATPFMVLLAAFSTLLARWSGSDDMVVGSPVAGRFPEETEGLIGVFVNTLALRTDLSGEPTFRQALRRVRRATVDAYAHQEVPFERLVEALKVDRDLAAHPVFQVIFSMHPEGSAAPELPGLELEIGESDTGTSKVDLVLNLSPTPHGIQGAWQYATDLWDAETIERLSRHLAELLSGAVARPDTPIWALPVMDAAEEDYVVRELNRTDVAYPRGLGVHQLFEAQADRTPGATAIVHGGARWSYAEVESRANRLARRLRALGVGPEAKVAVCMERTPELVVALLATMKAGGAYVPVDPAYPADRIGFMVDESGAPVVLTHASLAGALPPTSARVIPLDAEWDEVAAERDTRLDLPVDERTLAYVIYTSGSTGRPKGVQIEHRSTVALLHWLREHVSDGERRSVLASTSVSFDVSVAEIFGTLSWGGSLVLVRNALSLKGLEEEVTLASMAPSAAAELLRTGGIPPTLRRLNLGGEALPPALARGLHEIGTLETVGNYYGPTEDTTYSTWWIAPRDADRVLVGRPVANTRLYVLDGRLRPVPFGVAGELWIGGRGLSRGYHRRPAMTAERFRPDPFCGEPGARMYRVGDRVRYRAGGELEYLGRLDFQVKIRGHRIEPGEVEAALAASPRVRQAVVAARGEGAAARLVAWVVPSGEDAPSTAELRAWLRARVPDYMIPAAFVALPELPLSPNGKIDRLRLPDAAPERPAESAPRSEMERAVAKVWEDALETPGVGLDDNFFEIGGHSLLLARVQERLRETLGVPVSVIDLFQFSTVRALAAHLEQQAADAAAGEAPKVDTAAAETGQDRAATRREMMRRGRR